MNEGQVRGEGEIPKDFRPPPLPCGGDVPHDFIRKGAFISGLGMYMPNGDKTLKCTRCHAMTDKVYLRGKDGNWCSNCSFFTLRFLRWIGLRKA